MSRTILLSALLALVVGSVGCYHRVYYTEWTPPPVAVVPAPAYIPAPPHVHGPGCGHYFYDGGWYYAPPAEHFVEYVPAPPCGW